MIDFDSFAQAHLTVLGVPVLPAVTEDVAYPCVLYHVSGGGQQSNGPGLWDISLTLTVLGTARQGFSLCQRLYDTVHSWEGTPGAGSPAVTGVQDTSLFTRSDSAGRGGKALCQWDGSFDLTVRG